MSGFELVQNSVTVIMSDVVFALLLRWLNLRKCMEVVSLIRACVVSVDHPNSGSACDDIGLLVFSAQLIELVTAQHLVISYHFSHSQFLHASDDIFQMCSEKFFWQLKIIMHCDLHLLRTGVHLTTSKVMVIVWRLRGNIIRTVLYWQRATSSMGTVNKNSSHSPVGPWVCLFVFFRLHDLSLCWCMFCLTLDSWVISLHVLALA